MFVFQRQRLQLSCIQSVELDDRMAIILACLHWGEDMVRPELCIQEQSVPSGTEASHLEAGTLLGTLMVHPDLAEVPRLTSEVVMDESHSGSCHS